EKCSRRGLCPAYRCTAAGRRAGELFLVLAHGDAAERLVVRLRACVVAREDEAAAWRRRRSWCTMAACLCRRSRGRGGRRLGTFLELGDADDAAVNGDAEPGTER